MKSYFLFTYLILFFAIPISAQTKKEIKEASNEEAYHKIKTLIESKAYIFEADWATTQKGRRINLTTNANQLIINKDSADIYLPYFGVSHNPSAGFKGDGGIIFKGKIKNYKVKNNDKKKKVFVYFNAGDDDFSLQVTTSGMAYLTVNSMNRNSINYDGKIKDLHVEK